VACGSHGGGVGDKNMHEHDGWGVWHDRRTVVDDNILY